MTTMLDRLPVEAIEARVAERKPVNWGRVARALLAAIPLLLGMMAGRVARGVMFASAAFMEGWDRGLHPAPPARAGGPRTTG